MNRTNIVKTLAEILGFSAEEFDGLTDYEFGVYITDSDGDPIIDKPSLSEEVAWGIAEQRLAIRITAAFARQPDLAFAAIILLLEAAE